MVPARVPRDLCPQRSDDRPRGRPTSTRRSAMAVRVDNALVVESYQLLTAALIWARFLGVSGCEGRRRSIRTRARALHGLPSRSGWRRGHGRRRPGDDAGEARRLSRRAVRRRRRGVGARDAPGCRAARPDARRAQPTRRHSRATSAPARPMQRAPRVLGTHAFPEGQAEGLPAGPRAAVPGRHRRAHTRPRDRRPSTAEKGPNGSDQPQPAAQPRRALRPAAGVGDPPPGGRCGRAAAARRQ